MPSHIHLYFIRKGDVIIKPIDLHIHSNKSDGTYTPTELVHYAVEKGLTAFALTDHEFNEFKVEKFKNLLLFYTN